MPNIEAFGSFTSSGADKTSDAMNTSAQWLKFPKKTPKVIRILPPLQGEDLPWVIIHQHFLKIPGASKAVPFNCPNRMDNKPCPACEQYDRLLATGNPVDEKLAKEAGYRPSTRGIARAIDREAPDAGVRPVGLSKTVVNLLNDLRKGSKLNPNGLDFTHPTQGFDLVVEYLGESPWYKVEAARQSSPIAVTDQGFDDLVMQMKNLKLVDFAKVPAYEDVVAKIKEATDEAGTTQAASAPRSSTVATNKTTDAF